jgi:hypothetical protein
MQILYLHFATTGHSQQGIIQATAEMTASLDPFHPKRRTLALPCSGAEFSSFRGTLTRLRARVEPLDCIPVGYCQNR